MASRNTREFRLKSSRAPYTRAGIRFSSNREPVVINGADITDDQLRRLLADSAAITVQVVDAKSKEPSFHVMDDGSAFGDQAAMAAEAEAIAAAAAAAEKAREKAEAAAVKKAAKEAAAIAGQPADQAGVQDGGEQA